MAIISKRCPVLGAAVTQVSDLEGSVTTIICPEYEESTGTCRLRKGALQAGPLGQLLERMSEDTLALHNTACVLRAT